MKERQLTEEETPVITEKDMEKSLNNGQVFQWVN